MNVIVFKGRLGADPETRFLQSDKSVCSFSAAEKTQWKDQNGEKITNWHRCEAWGKSGELINQYCKKGSEIVISGSVKYETYEKDGVKMHATKVVVNSFDFVSSNNQSTNESETKEPLPF